MHCIKCGTELKDSGVFCPKCLEEMSLCPVKPNTPVQLPSRPAAAPAKKKNRRERFEKPEDQIRHLKSKLRWLAMTLVVALIAFGLTAGMLLQLLHRQSEPDSDIGQNYGTMDSTEST